MNIFTHWDDKQSVNTWNFIWFAFSCVCYCLSSSFYFSSLFLIFVNSLFWIHLYFFFSSHWTPWVGYGVSIAVFLVLLPLTWTHYLWNKLKDPHQEQDTVPEPKNKILKLLYRASLKVVWSAGTRTILYLIMCICLLVCTMLELVSSLIWDDKHSKIYIIKRYWINCYL